MNILCQHVRFLLLVTPSCRTSVTDIISVWELFCEIQWTIGHTQNVEIPHYFKKRLDSRRLPKLSFDLIWRASRESAVQPPSRQGVTTVHRPVHSEISWRNTLVWVVQTTDCFEKSVQTTDNLGIRNKFWLICNEETDIHNYFSGHRSSSNSIRSGTIIILQI